MPSSSSASSNENEQPSAKLDQIVAPDVRDVSRLLDQFAVPPDAIARQVGANVEIPAQRREMRRSPGSDTASTGHGLGLA